MHTKTDQTGAFAAAAEALRAGRAAARSARLSRLRSAAAGRCPRSRCARPAALGERRSVGCGRPGRRGAAVAVRRAHRPRDHRAHGVDAEGGLRRRRDRVGALDPPGAHARGRGPAPGRGGSAAFPRAPRACRRSRLGRGGALRPAGRAALRNRATARGGAPDGGAPPADADNSRGPSAGFFGPRAEGRTSDASATTRAPTRGGPTRSRLSRGRRAGWSGRRTRLRPKADGSVLPGRIGTAIPDARAASSR